MDTSEKVRENRARRTAALQGLALRKSRRRDSHALDYGGYWLIEGEANAVVVGDLWGMSLDDVEGWLKRDRQQVPIVRFIPSTCSLR